jgi:hypothetical protein
MNYGFHAPDTRKPLTLSGRRYQDLPLAIELAQGVRRELLEGEAADAPLLDLERKFAKHRLRVRDGHLRPEQGGPQAMLIPLHGDAFDVCIDPTPSGGWDGVDEHLRPALRRHRRRFLAAHEYSHSFFFLRSPGSRPRRERPSSPAEEVFCDEFARWLLIPREVAAAVPCKADSVFWLHRHYDVSVQLATRGLVEASDGRSWAMIAIHNGEPAAGKWKVQWASDGCPGDLSSPPTGALAELWRLCCSGASPGRAFRGMTARFDCLRRQLVLVGAV